ncbi:COG3415 family protein [Candidatus Contubernalis alkaliaceticus]|uniref:transcriptional regulator n=1 Tax=Candidatus Contubernalis alkaliaceticus TaxID=338645 RepID=UPI001F4BEEBC|nr:transcriptional regulator [Candidatus Contubernalis alkalaceticus]UNC93411.1 transcriptional regulator [Candidatus Contubernalis alkalaceticus]
MELVRIGNKLVSKEKIYSMIDRIMNLRSKGSSQRETAEILGLDRSFISRLENVGEVRRGGKIALIGFPVKNKEELEEMAQGEGIDFVLLLTEIERRLLLNNRSGVELLNYLMDIIGELRDYDTVIILGSDERIKIVESLLDKEVVSLEIGRSPLTEDVYVEPGVLKSVISSLN